MGIKMRCAVILLCLVLVGCRGKRVVTEMTDTTKVRLDSVVVSTMRTERYWLVDSSETWASIEFGDSGGFVLMENGRLAADGVKKLRLGGKSSNVVSSLITIEGDSTAVQRTEDKGGSRHEGPQVQEKNNGGWWGYCLVFGVLLAGVMWCLQRRFCG